jgi:hypothetical protein
MNLPAASSRVSEDKTSVLTKNALPCSKLQGIIKLKGLTSPFLGERRRLISRQAYRLTSLKAT